MSYREKMKDGTVRLTGAPALFPRAWDFVTTYATGQLVGYAGAVYRSLENNTGCPPFMYPSMWHRVTSTDPATKWTQSDPTFEGDILERSWETFWKTGTVSTLLHTAATEYGRYGVRCFLSASSSQRLYEFNENILLPGNYIRVEARCRLASAGSVTIEGLHMANDASGAIQPFGAGAVGVSGGVQTFTSTTWQTLYFYMAAANAKPRVRSQLIVYNTGATSQTLYIDSIKTTLYPYLPDTPWIDLPYASGWSDYGSVYGPGQYRREGGKLKFRGLIAGTTTGTVIATLPVGFRPPYSEIRQLMSNQGTSGAASAGTAHTHVLPNTGARIVVNTAGVITMTSGPAVGFLNMSDVREIDLAA